MSIEYLIFYIGSSILLVLFIITLYNYLTAPEINGKNKNIFSNRFISVLIPARNEESNIKDCLLSVINQNYTNFEIIVLDDESSDNTYEIVNDISANNKKVKLLRGKPLPAGWLGKNWACSQLAENSTGDILLFIDADVNLSDNAINSGLKIFEEK
ncbi:MAG: glycosyltransferase family 2 protein, partial [Ignavibacteriaceae bacterium]